MKTSLLVLGLAGAQGAFSSILKRSCNANNCLREIRGTDANLQPPLTSREADCSSFMLTTVTPLTYTTTATTTLTVTGGEAPAKRDAALIGARQVTVIPSSVPAYATFCTGTSAYSSACSCLGITAMTTFAPTPTSTTTVTATATVCPAGQGMCSTGCADLNSNDANCGVCGNACGSTANCVSGTCVSIYACSPANYQSCGGSCGGVCLPLASGNGGVCQVSESCDGRPSCTVDSDCSGGFCLNDGCGLVCTLNSALCPVSSAPSMLFRKRDDKPKLTAPMGKRTTVLTDSGPVEVGP